MNLLESLSNWLTIKRMTKEQRAIYDKVFSEKYKEFVDEKIKALAEYNAKKRVKKRF